MSAKEKVRWGSEGKTEELVLENGAGEFKGKSEGTARNIYGA